jgi:hypothetical protein
VNGTTEIFAVKHEKGTTVKRPSRFRRNQMISLPGSMLPLQNLQDIIPLLGLPARNVLIGDVGREISQTAAAAAPAFYFFPFFHHRFLSTPEISSIQLFAN